METPNSTAPHSGAWIAQAWISFGVAASGTLVGIAYINTDIWTRAFLGMGLLMSISSAFTLSKTLRDGFEAEKLVKRVDSARVEKLITEHDPSNVF